MIKQILNKLFRKQSKLLKNHESSGTQNPNVSISYESLPSFKHVRSSKKHNLFKKKVIMCTVIFDFTDPTKNLKEKEIKCQTLLELVDFVTSNDVKFKESVIHELVKMVTANLFRDLAPQQQRGCNILPLSYDLKEEQPSMDPSWPHLQTVYELSYKFIASSQTDVKIAKKFIDRDFVLKLLETFDSEDSREREYLMKILHRIYSKFEVHRPFIRICINNIFYRFVLETGKHNGISELLEVIISIVDGFYVPLKEENKLFLSRVLIPLHKPTCLAMYHQQLSCCIIEFVIKDWTLAEIVIRGLLKYWPLTNSSKEVMFLDELGEVLKATQQPQFLQCAVPLFNQISRCLNSLHVQVAEKAHLLWINDHIKSLIVRNRKVILPIIYPSLARNMRYHWNQSMHSLTLEVVKIFYDLDPGLLKECLLSFQEEEAEKEYIQSRRESTWKHLEEIAIDKGSSNKPFL